MIPAYCYETRSVTKDVEFLRVDGEEFEREHVVRVLEAIAATDAIARIVIHDKRLEALLILHRVFIKDGRGSGYKGDNWETWHRKFTYDFYETDNGRCAQRSKAERRGSPEPQYRRPPGT
jgi:hypothetical protein